MPSDRTAAGCRHRGRTGCWPCPPWQHSVCSDPLSARLVRQNPKRKRTALSSTSLFAAWPMATQSRAGYDFAAVDRPRVQKGCVPEAECHLRSDLTGDPAVSKANEDWSSWWKRLCRPGGGDRPLLGLRTASELVVLASWSHAAVPYWKQVPSNARRNARDLRYVHTTRMGCVNSASLAAQGVGVARRIYSFEIVTDC